MRTSLHHHAIRLAVSFTIAIGLVGCGDDDATSTTPPVAAATTDPPVSTAAAATTEAVDTTTATTVKVTTTTAAATTTTTAAPTTTQAAPTTPAPTTAPPAVPYTSPEGDFSVLFPGEPTTLTQPQTLPDGSVVDLVLVSYQRADVYIATARAQQPEGYVLDVPVALQGAQDQAVANTGATLISSEDITLQGRPGKQFSASLASGGATGTLLQRVYLDGLVLYQQVVSGTGERTFTDPDLATFFDSFAFTTG